MEQKTTENQNRINWLLMGAAIGFVALAVALCFVLRPTVNGAKAFRIRFGDGQAVVYPATADTVIVIRDGVLSDHATGEGEENIIHIRDGAAWMEDANCPHRECVEQGSLDVDTVKTRPLGPWIICAPHGVSIEYIGEDE